MMKRIWLTILVSVLFVTMGISLSAQLSNDDELSKKYEGMFEGSSQYVHVKKTTVSSFLVDGSEYNYSTPNGFPCWCEGKPDAGIGEWVRFEFNLELNNGRPYVVTGFEFQNGATYDYRIYNLNNRVKKMEIEFSTGKKIIVGIEDDPMTKTYSIPPVECEWMKFTILEVYPGSKYNDTCIQKVMPFRIYHSEQNSK